MTDVTHGQNFNPEQHCQNKECLLTGTLHRYAHCHSTQPAYCECDHCYKFGFAEIRNIHLTDLQKY